MTEISHLLNNMRKYLLSIQIAENCVGNHGVAFSNYRPSVRASEWI